MAIFLRCYLHGAVEGDARLINMEKRQRIAVVLEQLQQLQRGPDAHVRLRAARYFAGVARVLTDRRASCARCPVWPWQTPLTIKAEVFASLPQSTDSWSRLDEMATLVRLSTSVDRDGEKAHGYG